MTLLVAWAGVDTHGVSSMYIGSDSRSSWSDKERSVIAKYDFCRKVFAFSNSPDILGYCGDVLFPSIVLNQIVELGDAGLLFEKGASSKQKFQAIFDKLVHQLKAYPKEQQGILGSSITIIHGSKDLNTNSFECRKINWDSDKKLKWDADTTTLPTFSDTLYTLGSGAKEFKERFARYQKGANKRTSRNIFHCMCHSILEAKDPQVGGAPQLVGLIRKPDSNGVNFGIICKKRRYFLGARIDDLKTRASMIDWRNENFERCDGATMKKLEDAQAQPPSRGHELS